MQKIASGLSTVSPRTSSEADQYLPMERSNGMTASTSSKSAFGLGRICMLALFLAAACFLYFDIDTRQWLQTFLLQVEVDRWGSLQKFVSVYTAAVVLLFPCMILQVVSGALYGFWYGFLVSWVATSVGQSLAFVLGRYLFRALVKNYLRQTWPTFPVIDAAIKQSGWKLTCLLRLSPVLPYNILNYALALTPVSFWVYTGASSLAMGGSRLLVSILSFIVIVVTSVYGYIISHRAIVAVLKDAEDQMDTQKLDTDTQQAEEGARKGAVCSENMHAPLLAVPR
eukprot:gene10152-8055_t